MKDNYELTIGSPNEYNDLVVYIWINGEQVAIIQQDEGKDKLRIDFFEEPIITKIYLDDFLDALNAAKKEILNCK